MFTIHYTACNAAYDYDWYSIPYREENANAREHISIGWR